MSEIREENVLLTQTRELSIKIIPLVFQQAIQQYQKLPTDGSGLAALRRKHATT